MLNDLSRVIINIGDNAHAANVEDSNMNMDCLVAVKVRTMHLSSRILASKSPFFYKVDFSSLLV